LASLKDVAGRAGVSIAAASAALTGRESRIGVSPETRERIRLAARELGYKRNPFAASLRTGKTYNIGVWFPDAQAYLSHPQGARNFWTICQAAAGHGYHVSVVVPDGGHTDARRMDGCLIMGPLPAAAGKEAARLAKAIPVLSLVTPSPGAVFVRENLSWVSWRRRAAEYLYRLGHRRVAVVHYSDRVSQAAIPGQFEDVAAEMGIRAEVLGFGEEMLDRQHGTVRQVLGLKRLPTAVFAIDDDYARTFILHAMGAGLRIPGDISVFSGSTRAEPEPGILGLTGLVLRSERQLQDLFRQFVAVIEGKLDSQEVALGAIEVELVERESCGPPRA